MEKEAWIIVTCPACDQHFPVTRKKRENIEQIITAEGYVMYIRFKCPKCKFIFEYKADLSLGE